MDILQLRLLGTPEALFAGRPLKFRSRKVLALLIYLVVEGGMHRREKLVVLLWPESDPRLGRASLRNTMARLRQALGEAGEFLLVEPGAVGFDFEQPLELDLRLVDSAGQPGATPELMSAALEANRGSFLEGFSLTDAPDFDDWMAVERAAWQRRLERVYEHLWLQQLESGQSTQAVDTAGQWLAHAPYSELACRALMEAHALAGDRAAALHVYELCRQTLNEALDVDPALETIALAERIRHADLLPRPVIRADPGAMATAMSLPLVGRTVEHSQMVATYRQATQGAARVVTIMGEAGMGKTRLADAFLEWAAIDETSADILRGRAFETGGRLPYQPLVDALRVRLERENAPDDLLEDVWLAELSQLLPELRGRYPDLPQPMSGQADFVRARLFEAIAILGCALAARRPIVFFLDDLQWADEGTLDMLHYLVRRWADSEASILLVLAVRQEGLTADPLLRDWMTRLGRALPLAQLELPALAPEDLRQLVGVLSGANSEAEAVASFADWLHSETAGSPFFVEAVLQMLLEQGHLGTQEQEDGQLSLDITSARQRIESQERLPVPPTIRELLLARMGQLSEKAAALLLAAAVIGRKCSFERLCQVAKVDEFDALAPLEELVQGRLLVEMDSEHRPFHFAHDNIRQVAYTEAGTARRRLYHRQVFVALEQDGAPPAELAFHAAAAQLTESAFQYALAAGDRAMELYAYADALTHYSQALQLVEQVISTSLQRCHLCIQHGRALELNGCYAEALASYEEMERRGKEMDDGALELAALAAQGTIYSTANDQSNMALGETLSKQALDLAQELDDGATEAKVQWNLLNVYRMTNRNELAIAAGERSFMLARRLGQREQIAYTANDLSYVYQTVGQIDQALAVLETATELWRDLGNQPMLTDSLTSHAFLLAFVGDFDTALAISREAQKVSNSLDNPWAQSYSLYSVCLVHWFRLEVTLAIEAMQRCISLARQAGFVGGHVIMSSYQAQLLLDLGHTSRARDLVEGMVELAAKNIPLFMGVAAGTEALIALQEGDHDEAEVILARFGATDPPYDHLNGYTVESAACQLALQKGRYQWADRLAGSVAAYLKERHLLTLVPSFLYLQARALLAMDRVEQARQKLTEARKIAGRTGARWQLWQTLALLAEVAEAHSQVEEAQQFRTEARSVVKTVADQISDDELRQLFLSQPGIRALAIHQ